MKYNKAESLIASRTPEEGIGKDFFNDLAPCAKGKRFHGEFLKFHHFGQINVMFDWTFACKGADVGVKIHLKAQPDLLPCWTFVKRVSQGLGIWARDIGAELAIGIKVRISDELRDLMRGRRAVASRGEAPVPLTQPGWQHRALRAAFTAMTADCLTKGMWPASDETMSFMMEGLQQDPSAMATAPP